MPQTAPTLSTPTPHAGSDPKVAAHTDAASLLTAHGPDGAMAEARLRATAAAQQKDKAARQHWNQVANRIRAIVDGDAPLSSTGSV